MAISFLLALLDARPSGPAWDHAWLSDMLGEHLLRRIAADPAAPLQLRGWSVGSVVGNETFVQARPIVRDPEGEPVEDLLRTPAPCILAAFNAVAGNDRLGAEAHAPIRLARFRRWIGVRAEAELDPDTRRRMRQEVPDFLGRGQTLGNDGELVFLTFLAALHASGGLGSAYATPELVRRALRTTDALLGEGTVNLMVSDGRTLGVVHRGGMLLSFQPPTVGGRRALKLEDEARASARGNLLWFDPGPPAETPLPNAERIAEGIFTIESMRPRLIGRDPV